MQQYFAAAAADGDYGDDGDDGDDDFVCMEVYSIYSGSRVYNYYLTSTSGGQTSAQVFYCIMPPLAFILAA